ncbi:hypothetical protein SFRURICE_016355 [Spodoptera frugiperda]|uniref:SFRICE_031520 n=1 Tax=Spodoptera frugiperda TaxID=7108 RepID=A0A2H1WIK8_SPOFR|nr:hypothetical protein SFRURICE_016355 [Spodoptera frugiperda]
MNEDGGLHFMVPQKPRPFRKYSDGYTERNIYYAPRPFHFLYGDNLRWSETALRKRRGQSETADSFITESAIRSAFWSITSSPSNTQSPLECEQVAPDA